MASTIPSHTKILVIGGGPAGTTAATFLAREGHEVVLLERDFFPRYHIGESLLVSVQETLQLLGLKEKVTAHGFLKKSGAILNWGDEKWNFDWSKLPSENKSSFQVKRAEFDDILIKHTATVGTKVFEGVTVNTINFDGDKPISVTYTKKNKEGTEKADGAISFDWLIDCSGRTGLMSNKYLKSRVYNNAFKNIALWSYWKNVQRPDTGHITNPIIINSIQNGWNWVIPLHDDTCSIGVVMRHEHFQKLRAAGESKEKIYEDSMNESPPVVEMLKAATMVHEVNTEGDYSYHSNTVAGPRYFMCGDSACFLDPLLSTGCHLAMYSATLAAASILSVFRNEVTEEEALDFFSKSYLKHFTRWVLVVGSLSNLRAGKESYFWSAQSLITDEMVANKEEFGETIRQSFSKMVSGMEDIKESQDTNLFKEFNDKLVKKLKDDGGKSSFPAIAMNLMNDQEKKAAEAKTATEGSHFGVGIEAGSILNDPSGKGPTFMDGAVGNIQMVSQPRLGLKKIL